MLQKYYITMSKNECVHIMKAWKKMYTPDRLCPVAFIKEFLYPMLYFLSRCGRVGEDGLFVGPLWN